MSSSVARVGSSYATHVKLALSSTFMWALFPGKHASWHEERKAAGDVNVRPAFTPYVVHAVAIYQSRTMCCS